MKRFLVLLSLLLLMTASHNAWGNNLVVQVSGDVPMTNTGIYLTAGSEFHITATGLICYDGSYTTDPNGWVGTNGNFMFLLSEVPALSLVGCVGETSPVVNTGFDPEAWTNLDLSSTDLIGNGFIGSDFTGTSPSSGYLYLGYNDRYFPDNSGYYTVQVDVVPEPSTIALLGMGVIGLLGWAWRRRKCANVNSMVLAALALLALANSGLLPQHALAQYTPEVNWTRQLGTTAADIANRVSADGMGNIYIGGATGGILGAQSTGNTDAFVTKYDSAGNRLWTGQFGATDSWYAGIWGISADKMGNVFASGWTWGSIGGTNPTGAVAAFITKYNSSGSQQWTRQIAAPGDPTLAFGVSTDGLGNAYVSGHTTGSLGVTNAGGWDAYLAKYDGNGNRVWCKQFGTTTNDQCRDLSADGLGNVYAAGFTDGALGGTNAGGLDAFVTKYDSAGNQLWARQFGTASDDKNWGVSADKLGNVFIGGTTAGSLAGTNSGGGDAFIAKYDSAGNLSWQRQFGSVSDDIIYRISSDGKGNVFVAGETTGALAGTAPDSGYWNAFPAEYDTNGNRLWLMELNTRSPGTDGWGVSADGLGTVYLAGGTDAALDGFNAGGLDAFVVSVPEPSTLVLLATSALGLLGWAWRKRASV